MKVYGSVAGMISQMNKIDLISNNVANINTTSFKEQMSNTRNYTINDNLTQYPSKNLPFRRESSDAKQFVLNTLNALPIESDTFRNTKNGSLKETGNKLDFALTHQDKFFLVRNQEGKEYLTRDGHFRINENGIVVNNNGEYVLSDRRDLLTLEDIQDLGIYTADFKELTNAGENLYNLPNDLGNPEDNGSFFYENGYLESSNVNGVRSMTELINAQRLFDQLKAVNQTQQDMEKKSNSSIGDHQS